MHAEHAFVVVGVVLGRNRKGSDGSGRAICKICVGKSKFRNRFSLVGRLAGEVVRRGRLVCGSVEISIASLARFQRYGFVCVCLSRFGIPFVSTGFNFGNHLSLSFLSLLLHHHQLTFFSQPIHLPQNVRPFHRTHLSISLPSRRHSSQLVAANSSEDRHAQIRLWSRRQQRTNGQRRCVLQESSEGCSSAEEGWRNQGALL